MAPLTLLSLNHDVLSEILAHLLLDTSRELNRTSVLQTCSSLHLLGLPHLYRIVDLTRLEEHAVVLRHWKTLFGERGVFSVKGRNLEVGGFVRELRLGGTRVFDPLVAGKEGFNVPELNLPNCSSLLLDFVGLSESLLPSLPLILSQLAVTRLWLRYEDFDGSESFSFLDTFGRSPMAVISPGNQLWMREFDVLTVQGWLWYDELRSEDGDFLGGKLSFSDLSIRVLVLRPHANALRTRYKRESKVVDVVTLFLDVKSTDQHSFLPRTERIEFRGGATFIEKEFRQEVESRESKSGLSEFERRIASLIVFVDKDGTERWLLEE